MAEVINKTVKEAKDMISKVKHFVSVNLAMLKLYQ